ncbi:hypothetical protein BH10PAT1_BH10PAT1_4610 [soil metagenome]
MNIIIYTTSTCPYCKMLEDFLKEKKVVYTKKTVDTDDVAKEEMMRESDGFLGVPFTVITKPDNTKEKVIGFDEKKISAILNI